MGVYVLGVDIGTSACKAALFDENGTAFSEASGAYAVHYKKQGWAEQEPDEWWHVVCQTIREVIAKGGIVPRDIAGIGVDGQSWSAIAVDAKGNVLAPTPIWTDTRAQVECEDMLQAVPEETLFALCGNPVKPGYTLPKILWYKKHCPHVYENAAYILQSNSFIVYRLTGAVTQDISQGYGFCCFDMRKGEWDKEIAKRCGIRESLLPDVYESHQVVGQVTKGAAALTGLCEGTPVVAGGLDAACGTLGAGVIAPGQTQEQGGQAGGMSLCMDSYAADPRLILSHHVVPGKWLLQGGTTGGGGALKWLRENMRPDCSFEDMSRLAQTASAGSEGVTFLPYMAGERSPIWNPDAKAVFYGLGYGHDKSHMVRSVMEGVAYALKHNLETAKSAGANLGTLRAMGGSANSLVWTQIKSDVTGLPIEVPLSDTATTLGAAILAGVGTGVYASFEEAVARTVSITRTHEPNEALKPTYDIGYERYLELYERLCPMMKGRERE